MTILSFKSRIKRVGNRELDICDVCYRSAYVDEGRFIPATMPTPQREGVSANFICKACLGTPPATKERPRRRRQAPAPPMSNCTDEGVDDE